MISNSNLKYTPHIDLDFQKDITDLFLENRSGHMEKWEYSTPLYAGDPSGGIAFWAELIKNPGNYYLIDGDVYNVQQSLKDNNFLAGLARIEHLIELGAGCKKSLSQKTLPIIKSSPNLKTYQVIDGTYDVSHHAGDFVAMNSGLTSIPQAHDFIEQPFVKAEKGLSALVFWGGSIGNFSGKKGESPFQKLVKQLHNFQQGLDKGDFTIISFDGEQDETKIKNAYNEINLKREILSVFFKARRDGILSSGFNPYMWEYEPVWVPELGQCCHTVYPVINQEFQVSGIDVFVSEGKRFISNNSYKYTPDLMISAASMAGFSEIKIFKHGAMGLLVAQK